MYFDAADAFDRAVLVVELIAAGAVEDLEVLERVLLDDDEVGEHAGLARADRLVHSAPSASAPLRVAERITSSGWKPASCSSSSSRM